MLCAKSNVYMHVGFNATLSFNRAKENNNLIPRAGLSLESAIGV